MNTESSDSYFSDQQLAARFSVSRSTVWRWVAAGKLAQPVRFSPGCSRWPASAVEEFERRARGAA